MSHTELQSSARRIAPITAIAGRKRTVYAEGARRVSVGRLTTRCPTLLRNYLSFTASNPALGYRSMTDMVTRSLVEFLNQLPAPGDPSLVWAKGRGAGAGRVLVHANTERCTNGSVSLDGVELAQRALASAEAHGVTMSSFTLTLLFWMATTKHPAADAKMRRALDAAKKTYFAPSVRGAQRLA